MLVQLDENGLAIPDVKMAEWVDERMSKGEDIHVANLFTIDHIRVWLLRREPQDRPEVRWVFYGREVHFDGDLRSFDAWSDPRTCLLDDILMAIAFPTAGDKT